MLIRALLIAREAEIARLNEALGRAKLEIDLLENDIREGPRE